MTKSKQARKARTSKSKSLPARKVTELKPAEQPGEIAYWRLPTAHSLKLDEARLAHWWAKLNGGDTVKTLAAWATLLHVPRTKAKA